MTLRILFAEPDEMLCELYSQFFAYHGIDVRTATGVFDCLKTAASFDPHILVLDDELHFSGAASVLALLRNRGASCDHPVVLVTGDTKPHQLSSVLGLPVEHCFRKPVSLNCILDAIRSATPKLVSMRPAAQVGMNSTHHQRVH